MKNNSVYAIIIDTMSVDTILQQYDRFGIDLGLDRVFSLLAKLGNPHDRVPIIHVAGTNGKGSVCAYLSSVLTTAGYRTGRYTSPHLIDWCERICINEKPIASSILERLLLEIETAIADDPTPTQFELFTVAAWLYFARENVDIAVMEVGLGGRLDATNVCDRPLVTAITSIGMDHWQQLGETLSDIATEKAGILKRDRPLVVGNLPPEAENAVRKRIEETNCPAVWTTAAMERETASHPDGLRSLSYHNIDYQIPLLGEFQRINSAIAIDILLQLRQQGFNLPDTAIQAGMSRTKWPGRMQWVTWRDRRILIDGAHNAAAAKMLRSYVEILPTPVTWVMGMLATKDCVGIFKALLREGDRLFLVPVPNANSANLEELEKLANKVCPQLQQCKSYLELESALEVAVQGDRPIVLCGSLYLVGSFFSRGDSRITPTLYPFH